MIRITCRVLLILAVGLWAALLIQNPLWRFADAARLRISIPTAAAMSLQFAFSVDSAQRTSLGSQAIDCPVPKPAAAIWVGHSASRRSPIGADRAPLLGAIALPFMLAQVDFRSAAKSFLDFISIILILLGVCLVAYGGILIAQGRPMEGTAAIVGGFVCVLAVPIIYQFAKIGGITF